MQQYHDEARAIIRLSVPVFIAQIAQTSMGFVDTVMAGGYSAPIWPQSQLPQVYGCPRSCLGLAC